MDFMLRHRLGLFEPNADVVVDEERGRVIVAVEVAGADPETFQAAIDGRTLYIGGRRAERSRLRGSFAQKEIAFGDFGKQIHLPVAVDFEEVTASYVDGVLLVALPISATAYLPTARTEIRIVMKRSSF